MHESSHIHPSYLPFTRETLRRHFAKVRNGATDDRHLTHYVDSAARARSHARAHALGRVERRRCRALEHQVEKDERFWVVAALLAAFHDADRVTALSRVLRSAFDDGPPADLVDWRDALGPADELQLYFEVNLPAPASYQRWLKQRLGERTLIPWLVESASGKSNLEGSTKADAMLIAPSTGFAVVFEAKVLSDASTHTTYDALRNQIARNIDVLLDANPNLEPPLDRRRTEHTCFVLITPQVFQDNPHSRLYGKLMDDYRYDLTRLQADLPHREPGELASVPGRLGWTTWEQIEAAVPGACRWLPTSGGPAPGPA